MDLFDTLTFAEILGRTTFLGTLSLIVLVVERPMLLANPISLRSICSVVLDHEVCISLHIRD
jgi:hypothetical protein